MTPEGAAKKDIKDWLDKIGAYYFMPVQSGYGRRTVDFLVCWRGQFIAVEAKAPGKKATKFQQRVMLDITVAGGRAVCVDSLDKLVDWWNGT